MLRRSIAIDKELMSEGHNVGNNQFELATKSILMENISEAKDNFLDYLVRSPGRLAKRKKTRMVSKKSPAIWGKVVDIEWKGDFYLSQQLKLDYRLKDILLQTDFKKLKSKIEIFPESKYEYARVRTAYFLPSPDLFEAIDIIARHVKSG